MDAFISHHNNRKLPTRKASSFYTEGWVYRGVLLSYFCLFLLGLDMKYKMVQKKSSMFNGELITCWWSATVLSFNFHIFCIHSITKNDKSHAAQLTDKQSTFRAVIC